MQNNPAKNLGLYIHIPFCERKCRYCAFYSEPVDRHDTTAFVAAVLSELDTARLDPAAIQTVYIGGGSPTCLPDGDLFDLVSRIAQHSPNASEFTIEANPGQLTRDKLDILRGLGVNRLSIGVQSFIAEELALLGRNHSPEHIAAAVTNARDAGFDNISLDLIFAIPGQTLDALSQSLQRVVDLGVQHISAYSLSYEPGTPLHTALQQDCIQPVGEDLDRQMYEHTIDTLNRAGFEHYEISNFARPGRACRHNLTYWANTPWVGLGPSAASWFGGKRTTNVSDIYTYLARIGEGQSTVAESHRPSPEDIACETAVLNLRRIAGIDTGAYKIQTGFDLYDLFGSSIADLCRDDLLESTGNHLRLSRDALPIADTVLAHFAHPD